MVEIIGKRKMYLNFKHFGTSQQGFNNKIKLGYAPPLYIEL